MTTIRFIEANGTEHSVETEAGTDAMRAALAADVPGIMAECGGAMSCGTCHVYVAPEWLDRIPPAGEEEEAMIECVIDPEPNSRLSCQIAVTQDLDGLVLHLPVTQI